MKKGLFFLAFLFAAAVAEAQCEQCSPVSGEIIDYCYTESGAEGRCASFAHASETFHFEDKSRKKDPILKFSLPEHGIQPSIPYLLGIAADKKLKLSAADLLFMEHAIQSWLEVDALTTWNLAKVNSGYTLLPSGLAYKVLRMGSGRLPANGNTVMVHYTGYLADGKKFDSSLDRKHSFRFVLGKGQVIKGWDEGVALMPIGSRFLLRLPPELGWGDRGARDVVPPNATLYFDMQLLAAE